jgi:hypothetical protein
MEEARAPLLETCHMCERLSRMQQLTDFCARRGLVGQWTHEIGDCRCASRNYHQIKGQLRSTFKAERGASADASGRT